MPGLLLKVEEMSKLHNLDHEHYGIIVQSLHKNS